MLADPLSRIANHYAAIVIDTRPSFSLMTEMGLIAATDAIVPVEPRYHVYPVPTIPGFWQTRLATGNIRVWNPRLFLGYT